MKFRKEDFKKSTRLRVYMEFAFALEDGPRLVGPIPVIIETETSRHSPEYGERYIRVGKTKYWEHYGSQFWGNSGYFLVFRTAKQLKGKTRFILED